MKKTTFSWPFGALKFASLVTGLVFSLMLTSAVLQAQNYVDGATATLILKTEMVQLENQKFYGNPSGQDLAVLNNKILFFGGIANYLLEGIKVETAIFDGYSATLGSNPGLQHLPSADIYYDALKSGNPIPSNPTTDNIVGSGGGYVQGNPYLDAAIQLLSR
jgi:hypothetical protein